MDLAALHTMADALKRADVAFALGGSGLLYALGLGRSVRDWDLTTEAPLPAVMPALDGLAWADTAHGDGPFASAYRLSVQVGAQEIDLIGSFAYRADDGVCHLPTMVSGAWQGVPLGSPAIWAVAYRLMGRDAKADLLSAYVRTHGAEPEAVARLLAQPLPGAVRDEVLGW